MEEKEKYKRAKERVEEIKSFYSHLFIYIIVILALFIINILTSREYLWFYWPLFGWGIGILFHAISVFGTNKFLRDWEERKIKELMEEEKKEGK